MRRVFNVMPVEVKEIDLKTVVFTIRPARESIITIQP